MATLIHACHFLRQHGHLISHSESSANDKSAYSVVCACMCAVSAHFRALHEGERELGKCRQ